MDAYTQCSARANKRECVFDRIVGFEGAYKLLKTEGQPALEAELSRRGMGHKAKSIDLAQTAQRLEDSIQRRKTTGHDATGNDSPAVWERDDPASAIDESLLIEDDRERLSAKADAIGIQPAIHAWLMMKVDMPALERAYDVGLPVKEMPEHDRLAFNALAVDPLIPESVQGGLSKQLGTGAFNHLMNELRIAIEFNLIALKQADAPEWMQHDRKMKELAALGKPLLTPHPTFGARKVKGDVPREPGTHPTFGVPYNR